MLNFGPSAEMLLLDSSLKDNPYKDCSSVTEFFSLACQNSSGTTLIKIQTN